MWNTYSQQLLVFFCNLKLHLASIKTWETKYISIWATFFKTTMTSWGLKCLSDHQLWWSIPIGICLRHCRLRWIEQIDFSFPWCLEKNDRCCRFKAFVSTFLYSSLHKGKIEVITHSQCGLRFFIQPLGFLLMSKRIFYHFWMATPARRQIEN